MKILLIEDDEEKAAILADFIKIEFPVIELDLARSFGSGLRSLMKGGLAYKLLLLDMSMPIYDVTPTEPGGGKPESFAGSEILAQMRLRGIEIPTIVVTMFDKFGDEPTQISLEELKRDLEKFSPTFRGITYYNSAQEGWRASLKKLMNETLGYK